MAPAAKPEALKDQMRPLWEPSAPTYLRDFLVCGPFFEPVSPAGSSSTKLATSQPATAPAATQPATDYLAAVGGEANVRPQKGQTVTAQDGTPLEWKSYTSAADLMDVREPIPAARPKACVVYAYATIHRDNPGKAVLSLYSRGIATVYLNGKVVMAIKTSTSGKEVTVSLAQGDNALLVRIAGTGDRWTFSLAVNDQVDTPTDDPSLLHASIVPSEGDKAELAVQVSNDNRLAPPMVSLEVLALAGKVVERAEVPLGQTHTFNIAAWADGPYEIRALARTPDEKPLTSYQIWYKGDWKKEVAKVLKEAEKLPADSDDPVVLKKRLVRDILLTRLASKEAAAKGQAAPAEGADAKKIIVALMEYREAEPLEKNPAAADGFCRLGWRDEVDGSPQFARVYLPLNYDPARKYPLVVFLHGHNSRNPEYAAEDPATRHRGVAEKYDVIRLEPYGRGNAGYRGFGEADVMRAIALTRQKFSVDGDRIYLMGTSMGGGGAWYLGTRHTDVFAAVAPKCGGWDYHVEDEADVATWSPQRLALEDSYSSFAQAESMLHTPVFVNHGDSDKTAPVENSRYVVRMLQRWGYDIRYQEHPGKGHTGWDAEDDVLQWFLTKRLCRDPQRVLLRAPYLYGADAHWVHAEQQEDPFTSMQVEAVAPGGNTVLLWSRNVLQLRLNPGKDLGIIAFDDAAQPFRVIWNGQEVAKSQVTSMPDGQIVLRAEGYAPGKLVKKPMGQTPFALVVGTTSKDERMRRFCQLLADRLRDDWKEWQHVEPRVFKDTEITDKQIRKYSLILFGGPEDNAVTARLMKGIPLTIELNRITLDGRAFDATDAAVRMVYPHPLNADRDVTVIAANSANAMFWAGLLSDEVDFVIDDGRVGPDRDYFRNIVAWGRFDHNWRLDEKYLTVGDPSARAQAGRRKAPTRLSLATAEPMVPLSEVVVTKDKGAFCARMSDLNRYGKPITLAGKTYAKGITLGCREEDSCLADYDLTGGNWKRLKATIGLETYPQLRLAGQIKSVKVTFLVRGDGKELYKSPSFGSDSKPLDIDVDVAGVKNLELEVRSQSDDNSVGVDWADIRLEK
jgi:enterochelin esterase-like enzyme